MCLVVCFGFVCFAHNTTHKHTNTQTQIPGFHPGDPGSIQWRSQMERSLARITDGMQTRAEIGDGDAAADDGDGDCYPCDAHAVNDRWTQSYL